MESAAFEAVQAANKFGMPLHRGGGGPEQDHRDEYVVYVYDTNLHPFFRA